jgi:hypothetical protein
MREALGGSLILKIILIFITLYIAFLAIALSYSNSFKAKNIIVSIIEENEGYPGSNDSTVIKINSKLEAISYSIDNYKVTAHKVTEKGVRNGYYYQVTTYIIFDFPIVNIFFRFPITGKTRVIYR